MLAAALYDIHGNLPALEAVVGDARDAGAERFVLGGDYVLFGAYPREVFDLLHELDATWIRGNTERWLGGDRHDLPAPAATAIPFCNQALGQANTLRLENLDKSAAIDGVLFCHGSPHSDMESFSPDPGPHDEELLREAEQQTVVFGHTHIQFTRELGQKLLVNPGSVGMPWDGDPRAAYALWRGGDHFELRRVEYDHLAYAREVRERMTVTVGDFTETLVSRIEQSKFDV